MLLCGVSEIESPLGKNYNYENSAFNDRMYSFKRCLLGLFDYQRSLTSGREIESTKEIGK